MKFIHITDTHFVPKGEMLYGQNPRERLDSAVADINQYHPDAEVAVITGDLTHWGEEEAFENLREALSAMRIPVQLLVGNHDDRNVFAKVFPDQARDRNGFVQSSMDGAAGRMIFLDTNLEGTHTGHYCSERKKWLTEQLFGAGDRDVFLFMHHPPFDIGLPAVDRLALQDAAAFRAVIEPFRQKIRHLFFGHVHRPVAGSWLGIPVTTLRAINHQIWLDMYQAEHLTGSFEPPAYCVVLIDADQVIVHFHDFMDASTKFSTAESPWDDWARKYAHP